MKNIKIRLRKIKFLLQSVFKNFSSLLLFFKYIRNEDIYENDKHILLAANWLLKAQETGGDDGYSRGFYLYKSGWDKSYIETTGYIIPTMLEVYEKTKDERYYESAYKAGIWLLGVQKDNGAFTDIDNDIELVFDTGQVLYGLIALYENEKIDKDSKEKFKIASYKACEWLCSVQDIDGSWTAYGFNKIPHSYYSRVASILYKAGCVFKNDEFKKCADKNISWVLSRQKENGFFDNLKFQADEENVLHTMIYVLEGLFDYYTYTQRADILDSLLKNANILKEININKELLLSSQYNDKFESVNNERCITGLAQWANLSFKLYELTKDAEYLLCARKTLYYIKSKQFKEGNDLMGSLPGSVPFWGVYAPFSAVNWSVKFFIDALLQSNKYKFSLIEDSNLWIGECFKFNNDVVDTKLTYTAQNYIKILSKYIKDNHNILDLGCGKGKYIDIFSGKFENKNIVGIDPYYYNDKNIFIGDTYAINSNIKFDLIYCIEVLQHVKYIDVAIDNIKNNLVEKDGLLIICDRNPISVIGFLKSIWEFRGKWMYPFDSPFIEKWYTINRWKQILTRHDFIVYKTYTFCSRGGRSIMNRYSVIIAGRK